MSAPRSRGLIARALVVAGLGMSLSVGAATTAAASNRECAGRGVPTSKISIQLFTFAQLIGFEPDAGTAARTEEVLRRLSEMGYRNVEPYSLSGLTATQYRALLDKYHLKASARHVDVGTPAKPANIDQILADNKILGIKYFGSGATTNFATEAEWIAYAKYLNEVGEKARLQGQTLMVHNHNWEFQRVFNGRTAYDILMEYTDPRNVVFQLDLYWAVNAGVDPVALLERYGKRIQLFHVKDLRASDKRIEIVGEGSIDFPRIFAASKGPVKYYVVEHDPRFNDPTFDPYEAAQKGFTYLDCVSFGKKGSKSHSSKPKHSKGKGHGHSHGQARGHSKGKGHGNNDSKHGGKHAGRKD